VSTLKYVSFSEWVVSHGGGRVARGKTAPAQRGGEGVYCSIAQAPHKLVGSL